MYQRVWWGVEGEMELKDRFYGAAVLTTIFGNRQIPPDTTVGSLLELSQ